MARKKSAAQLIREATQRAVRETAASIMNDLAEAGPEWSGRFKNSWIADSPGYGGSLGKKGKYPYTVDDVAKLKTTIKATEATPVKIRITNTAPWALYAMDLREGQFRAIGEQKGVTVRRGKRNLDDNGVGLRGDLGGTGTNISTAPKDWYMTYINGGGLKRAVESNIRFGFRRAFR